MVLAPRKHASPVHEQKSDVNFKQERKRVYGIHHSNATDLVRN